MAGDREKVTNNAQPRPLFPIRLLPAGLNDTQRCGKFAPSSCESRANLRRRRRVNRLSAKVSIRVISGPPFGGPRECGPRITNHANGRGAHWSFLCLLRSWYAAATEYEHAFRPASLEDPLAPRTATTGRVRHRTRGRNWRQPR